MAAKLLGVEPKGDRFGMIAHVAMGIGRGSARGLIDLAGLRGAAAGAAFFAVAWTPDLLVPAAGAAEPPWRWGVVETAVSGLHHAVYAAAGDGVYRALNRG